VFKSSMGSMGSSMHPLNGSNTSFHTCPGDEH
jgi:hypothetical protein